MIAICARGTISRYLALITVAYIALALVFPGRSLIEFFDGMSIAMALAVVITYGAGAARGICTREPDTLSTMIVGICGSWLINALDRAFRLYIRVFQQWEALDNPVIGYFLVMLTVFAAMHLLVRGSRLNDGTLNQRSVSNEAWSVLVVTVVLGALLGAFSVHVGHQIVGTDR
jgi:uncharacterized membrane protein YeaQ/YmgE (transglycosylase-associated protein family)